MYMEISSKRVDKAIVIYVDGNLTTNSSPQVEVEINAILEGADTNVVINVGKVNYISSTGLRIILVLGKRLNKDGLELVMCSMNDTIESVFNISGFSKLFPIFETEEDALESL